jgi:predicted Rossmann fold flavoprotein
LHHDLLIIGGGASGLAAAVTAHDLGLDVCILEGSDRVGKKILVTGNGRCNIANSDVSFSRYHSNNSGFSDSVLGSFTVSDTVDFFSSLGLPLITLEEGKMFPMSLQASSVLDILRFAIEERSIPVYLSSKVSSIKKNNKGFLVNTASGVFSGNKIILASGGKSAPKTGSDGSGFQLAETLGHKIIKPFPALVQLKLDYNHLKALAGVKVNGFAEIFINKTSRRKEFGEILFTDYGISGPPVLQISRLASEGVSSSNSVTLSIDIMHQYDMTELKDFFENHWGTFSYRSIQDSLTGILHKKLIPTLLKQAGISNIHILCSDLTWKDKSNILSLLKNWEFIVSGTNSFSDSQVTAGGIDTSDVNASTLESQIIPGLFFAGEVLDVDGDCGGFNLQWAWSSGVVAARSASKTKNKD